MLWIRQRNEKIYVVVSTQKSYALNEFENQTNANSRLTKRSKYIFRIAEFNKEYKHALWNKLQRWVR